jgi:hypothetical protein
MNAMFENWCALNSRQPMPAAPMLVAQFVSELAPIGIDKVWEAVQDISRAHYTIGLADPTLGGPVALAINAIANLDPPHSWNKEEKPRFKSLPYDLQLCVLRRTKQTETEMRRAQSDAATLRNELKKRQQPVEATHGTETAAA